MTPAPGAWLAVKLEGVKSNRVDAQHNGMSTSVSYASSIHAPVWFGCGAAQTTERVEILWPSGQRQVLENVKAGQVLAVQEPGAVD